MLGSLLALVTLPASSSAASGEAVAVKGGHGPIVFPAPPPVEFRSPATKGYSIKVEGSAHEVTLTATGRGGSVMYEVRGRASADGIVARFGHLGRIDVRFEPTGKREVESPSEFLPGCKGKPRKAVEGFFVGTIRFAGERGFTKLAASKASGRTQTGGTWRCKLPGDNPGGKVQKPGGEPETAHALFATNRQAGLQFVAVGSEGGPASEVAAFLALLDERRDGMRISRSVFEIADGAAFLADDRLTGATVAPPWPFTGTATFARSPGTAPSWQGSLAVELPGTGRLPLVGPSFEAHLKRLDETAAASAVLPGI